MPALLALVFLLSGAAGLIYQVVWSRELVLVLGATSEAVAITVASFMAGLALGAAVAPRFAARTHRPVRLYAILEVGVAVSAGALPMLLALLAPVYWWAERHGIVGARLVLTGLLLLLPTALMGATLPVLGRLARERVGSQIALLYGANTLGATLGCAVAGFVLIELFGLTGAAAFAVGANLLAAALSMLADRRMTPLPEEPPAPLVGGRLFPAVFFTSGFLALALEILWTRLLLPRTGSEIYVFTAILAANLVGIGAGSLAYSARRGRGSMAELAGVLAFVGLASLAVVVLASGEWVGLRFRGLVLAMLPATFAMGWAFPLGIELATPPGHSASAPTGRIYSVNTVGGILGALAAPFVLAPLLGSAGAAGVLGAGYLVLGAGLALRAGRVRWAAAAGALATAAAVAAVLALPGFRHPVYSSTQRSAARTQIFEHAEDRVAAVTAGSISGSRSRFRRFLLVNGIGMTMRTADTKLLAHLPGLLHPEARRALVLCMGMGTSLRSSLRHPYERVDVVELVPTVPRFMRYFHPDAERVLGDPRAHIVIDDARHYLATTTERYGVVSSDPPPPIRSAGTVLLYSREFYQDGRRVLEPGGIFVQWFPFSQGTLEDYRTHVRTFLSVFPHVTAWRSIDDLGFYLVGSEHEVRYDPERAARVLADEGIRRDLVEWTPRLQRLGPRELAEEIGRLRIADRAQLEAVVNGGPIITDDRPISEYALLRGIFRWDPTPFGDPETVLSDLARNGGE